MIHITIDHFDIRAIADSGQCFRLNAAEDGAWALIAHGRCLRIVDEGLGRWAFDCTQATFNTIWRPYFDLDTDYGQYIASIPASDAYLARAAAFGRGIRILRQDPWEMLITFIISQQKNIPAIKKAVETLSERYGQRFAHGSATHHAFPTAQALAALQEDDLRLCSLGYRCAYIKAAAQMVAGGALDLAALQALPDDQLLAALQTVPGVGPKVASCVMLFGFHRVGAFPRDVWINRVVEREYGGHFPLERYEGYAGIMQQYMFYYARLGDGSPA